MGGRAAGGPGHRLSRPAVGREHAARAPPAKMMQLLGLTPFRAIKYDPPGPTACGVTCARILFLIPLLPLLGFLFNFTVGVRVLGRKAGGHGHDDHGGHGAHHAPSPLIGLVAAGTVFLSFLVAVWAVVRGPRRARPRDRRDAVDLAARRRRRDGRPRRGRRDALHRRVGLPRRPALLGDGPLRHLRRLPHPRLLDRVHGARPGLRPVHVVPEPLHVRDAHPRPGGQLRGPLRGVGGRRPLLVPPHRVLVPQAERLATPARRPSSSTGSATPASWPGCSSSS